MTDYVAILRKAVATLQPNTAEARTEIYNRARGMLEERLRSLRLPPSAPEARREKDALELAIRQVEARAASPEADSRAPADGDGRRVRRILRARSPALYLAGMLGIAIIIAGTAIVHSLWPAGRSRLRQERLPEQVSYVFLRQPTYYRSSYPEGTIIVDKVQHFLYLIRSNVVAIRYGIAGGPECADAAGLFQIRQKDVWPGVQIAAGELGKYDSLLSKSTNGSAFGARILHLDKGYYLHGTIQPNSLGYDVASGCFALANDDIIGIDALVPVGGRVVVQN